MFFCFDNEFIYGFLLFLPASHSHSHSHGHSHDDGDEDQHDHSDHVPISAQTLEEQLKILREVTESALTKKNA